MQKGLKVMTIILLISILLNIYLVVNQSIKSTYMPNVNDLELLAEMTKMVIETEEYKELLNRETIYAIKPGVSRFNVVSPSSAFSYEVQVLTENDGYVFYCADEQCSQVEIGGWTHTRYSEEEPILPLKNK